MRSVNVLRIHPVDSFYFSKALVPDVTLDVDNVEVACYPPLSLVQESCILRRDYSLVLSFYLVGIAIVLTK